MVLERIFPEDWLERKPLFAFLLGAGYALIGIIAARLIFPRDPALVAVAFISILLIPQLRKIFRLEERQERAEKRFSWKSLWRDDRDVVAVYVSLFFGILLVYAVATIWLPAFQVNTLFQQQLAYRGAAVGYAAMESPFMSILMNNAIVLLAVFLFGLLAGDGAVFLITWNASVWGTIFGATARSASTTMGVEAVLLLGVIFIIVLPHLLLEALSYIMAAISGSVISKDIEDERRNSKPFRRILAYNLTLLALAVLVLIAGALVESWVLTNIHLYGNIIAST